MKDTLLDLTIDFNYSRLLVIIIYVPIINDTNEYFC